MKKDVIELLNQIIDESEKRKNEKVFVSEGFMKYEKDYDLIKEIPNEKIGDFDYFWDEERKYIRTHLGDIRAILIKKQGKVIVTNNKNSVADPQSSNHLYALSDVKEIIDYAEETVKYFEKKNKIPEFFTERFGNKFSEMAFFWLNSCYSHKKRIITMCDFLITEIPFVAWNWEVDEECQ